LIVRFNLENFTMRNRNTPVLRFKGFNDKWDSQLLGNACTVTTGNKDTQNRIEGGLYPFFVRSNTVERINSYSFDGEAILTSGDGVGVGKNFHYINGRFDFHQRVYALVNFKKNYCGKFIYHVFVEKFYKRVIRLSAKNSVDSVRMNMITEMPIYFPSLSEQQKIATFLSAIDEKIQQLARKKELLEQYKKGVMQQLFSGKLRFKPQNGKAYPKWEEKRLGDLGNTFNGLTGKTKENFGEGKPYIQYMQIFANSKIDISKCGLVQINKNEEQQRVKYGDVFFTTSSETPDEIGTCSVLMNEVGEMYLNSFCFGFRPNSLEQLTPSFASYLFRNEIFRRIIIRLAQGSTRYNMSKVQLMKLRVLLPSKEEQQKIASYLSSLDTKIESVATQITQSQTFKKGLLQQMFV